MRAVKIILTIIALVGLVAVAMPVLLPGERIARLAADRIEAQTGRTLDIAGDVGFSWFPVFGVTTGAVTLGNAGWSENGPMFAAESASIGVQLLPALRGDIRIKRIELVRPDILLEKSAGGQANWDFGSSDSDGGGGLGGITIEHLSIRDARLRFVDPKSGEQDYTGIDISLRWPEASEPADITVSGLSNTVALTLTAQITDPASLYGGATSPLSATLSSDGGTITLDGAFGLNRQGSGRVTADLSDPARMLAAFGLSGWPGGAADASVDLEMTPDGILTLRNGKVSALGNDLGFSADIATNAARPVVKASITAPELDLSAFVGSDGASSNAWSQDPINADALGLFDGVIGIDAGRIDLGGISLGRSDLLITNDNSRAVLSLRDVQGFDGSITGELVANNRNGLSVGGTVQASGIELKSLLLATTGTDRLSGKGAARIKFLASGNSVHAIMNSLNGDGDLTIGRGIIAGIDLDQLFRGEVTGGSTVFDTLKASFTMSDGNLNNQDLKLELPAFVGTGKGRIGLGERTIDYTFTPQVKTGDAQILAVPVRIQGPWSSPKIWPDMEALIQQRLEAEAGAIGQQVEDRVKDAIGLGGDAGGTLEQVIEEKAVEGILNLLGGGN